ncbi:MAG: MFS transporter [Leptospira sp.]|nr:MFS transporter [Leptospira sp.]NCS95372.1 MFS transporter [Leptospira sp.]
MNTNSFPKLIMLLIFLAMLPVTMVVPVLKEMIKDIHLSGNLAVALFTSISMLGSFLFSPIAGMISDKLGNRSNIIGIAAIIDGILFFSLTLISDLNILMFVRFIEGATHIFVIGLLLASISDRENNPSSKFFQKGKLMGIAGMFLSLGAATGMPLGILGKSNALIPFYVGAGILFFIGAISLFFLEDSIKEQKIKFTFSHLIHSIQSTPSLLIPFFFHFIDRFTVGFLVSSFNIHMREDLLFHPGKAGAFLGLVLFPMSILSYPSAIFSKKYGILPLVLIGSIIYGIFLSLVGGTDDTTSIFIFLLGAGVGAGVMYVPSMILASRLAPKGLDATIMSGFTGFGSLGFLLGPIASVGLENFWKETESIADPFFALSSSFGFLEILMVAITIPFLSKLQKQLRKPS